ncbi:MAG: FKBP-type peptidyl-prolyl cis-trans isomerase [Bacteroidales bacterium]|jgi:FKBP-type peptidyl-prolyl cis-trans isomerase
MVKVLNKVFFTFFVFLVLVLFSCKNSTIKDNKPINIIVEDSILEAAHKEAVRKENIQINDFLSRYKWNVKRSGTGLYYDIYKTTNAPTIKNGDVVLLDYTIIFLNGDTVYSSQIDGKKEFVIGKSNEVSGLEEALLMMGIGEKARLIVPSYLAYGITGDFNKISINNTLVYDIEVIDVY